MSGTKSDFFCRDYIKSLSHFDLERYNENIKLCGVDPYELRESDTSDDRNLWPKISAIDRTDYFVYQKNFVSKDSMKSLKSLEGHNFFTSGFVFRPRVKKVSSELVVVLGKVSTPRLCSIFFNIF